MNRVSTLFITCKKLYCIFVSLKTAQGGATLLSPKVRKGNQETIYVPKRGHTPRSRTLVRRRSSHHSRKGDR